MNNAHRLALINQPYLKPKEVCELIGRSKPTVLKHLRTNGVEKTALGYWTDDIIRCFRLQGSIKRWKAEE